MRESEETARNKRATRCENKYQEGRECEATKLMFGTRRMQRGRWREQDKRLRSKRTRKRGEVRTEVAGEMRNERYGREKCAGDLPVVQGREDASLTGGRELQVAMRGRNKAQVTKSEVIE